LKEKEMAREQKNRKGFWIKGQNYFIRCVTNYFVGELVDISDSEIILAKASWVADTGRFYDAMAKGSLNEVEPYVGLLCE
jgi:hypothetical protein